MNIKEQFLLLQEWIDIWIELRCYVSEHSFVKIHDLPRFKNWQQERYIFINRPLQKTMLIRNNKIISNYCAGVGEPTGNWFYYYRYNTWHQLKFNISEKVFNPNLKDIEINEG